jgi:hypothetical protein
MPKKSMIGSVAAMDPERQQHVQGKVLYRGIDDPGLVVVVVDLDAPGAAGLFFRENGVDGLPHLHDIGSRDVGHSQTDRGAAVVANQ